MCLFTVFIGYPFQLDNDFNIKGNILLLVFCNEVVKHNGDVVWYLVIQVAVVVGCPSI